MSSAISTKVMTPIAATNRAVRAAISVRATVRARIKKGRKSETVMDGPNGQARPMFRSRVRDIATAKAWEGFAGLLAGFSPGVDELSDRFAYKTTVQNFTGYFSFF